MHKHVYSQWSGVAYNFGFVPAGMWIYILLVQANAHGKLPSDS